MKTHGTPMYLARARKNPVGLKARLAVAQSCANRHRDKKGVTLPKAPWEKDRAAGVKK